MSAFFSGTDDANENMNQFYGVWGRVEKDEPEFAFRWVCGDDKVEVPADLLIDWPEVTFKERQEIKTVRSLEIKDTSGLVNIQDNFYEQEEIEEPIYTERKELIKGPFLEVEYPEDWMPQHKKKVYVYPAYTPGKPYYPSYQKPKSYKNIELLPEDGFGDKKISGYGSEAVSSYNYGYRDGYYEDEYYGDDFQEDYTVGTPIKNRKVTSRSNRTVGRQKHKRK